MTLIHATILFLILGLAGWAEGNSPKRGGVYHLVNGTDGCPKKVEWLNECQGFTLLISESNLISGAQNFCHINQGYKSKRQRNELGLQKLTAKVIEKDFVIQKSQALIYANQDGSVSLKTEDTILYDETDKFMWEHKQTQRGFSCLYTK